MPDRSALFTESILVVNQKAKLIELTNEYLVRDQNGNQIGAVAEINQSTAKKIARFVSSLDQFMTHTYEIRDADEAPVLTLTRPRKIMKSTFQVSRADGTEVGQVKQGNVFGKEAFTTADNYVLEITKPIEDPLLSLVVAAALCVDTALKQDSK